MKAVNARQCGIDAYVAFFENLSPGSLADIKDLVTENVRFRDPFNDVIGPDAMCNVFELVFREITGPRFRITRVGVDGDCCLLKWTFTGQSRMRNLLIEGVSEITLDAEGRVKEHIDYWNAGEEIYEHIPVIGPLLRLIRRRIGTTKAARPRAWRYR